MGIAIDMNVNDELFAYAYVCHSRGFDNKTFGNEFLGKTFIITVFNSNIRPVGWMLN